MKKSMAVCLVFMLLLSFFTACGGQPGGVSSSVGGSSTAFEPDSAFADSEPYKGDEGTDADDQDVYVPGFWDGNVYTNAYLGLTAVVAENWQIVDSEQMAELNRQGFEQIGYTEAQIEQAMQKQIYDTMFADPETGNNIQITVEDMYSNDSLAEITYLEITKKGLEEHAPYDYRLGDNTTFHIGEQEFSGFDAYINDKAAQRICVCKLGRYMVNIVFTDMSGTANGLDEMMEIFQAL